MPNLTIRDIAKMAGVSTTAVSFVLNDRPGVSDATRAHVRAIIERTGFTPNVHTRRLNLGKSQTVHVVMRKHENGLFGQFAQETLQGIFKASHALGYSITFTFADRDAPCEQLIAMVHGKDCDGLILYQVSDAALIARLRQEQIPFVCVDAHLAQDGSLPLVEVDYYNAARQATQYLCQCGHREIGFIGTQVPNTYYMNTFGGYMEDMKEGMHYLWTEKGLLYITLYFIFCFMAMGASNVITLPYFKAGYANGEYIYMSVWGFMVLGRVLGGMMHYRLHLPEKHKFTIAVCVYVAISLLEGTYLYLPIAFMRLSCFLQGILGVTSYNIRISSTQSYVPDNRKGRFNGTFLMLTTIGSLLGQLLAGLLTEIMPIRGVLSLFMGISGASAIIIMGRGRNEVKPIYNKRQ